MTTTQNNLAETLALELKKPFELASQEDASVRRIALPPGWSIKEIDDEGLQPAPRRKVAAVRLEDTGSMIRYLQLHRSGGTTLWVSSDYPLGKLEISAILNDHGGTEYGQDWRDHRAYYGPSFSEEWKQWKSNEKRPMGQAEFASFLEDNLADIVGGDQLPSGADMLKMAIDFEAKQDLRFKSAIRLQSGGVDLAFVDQEDSGTLEKMKLFDRFAIGIEVFLGDAAYRIEARLRYRVKDGKLSFWYQLIRADKVIEAAALAIVEKISTETQLAPFFGEPFAA